MQEYEQIACAPEAHIPIVQASGEFTYSTTPSEAHWRGYIRLAQRVVQALTEYPVEAKRIHRGLCNSRACHGAPSYALNQLEQLILDASHLRQSQ